MPQPDLRVIAARYALRILQSDALARAADEAIDDGIYTPDLADIATSSQAIMAEIGPLFERALAELNIPIPTRADAVQLVLRDLILRIAEGRIAPRVGVAEIYELYLETHDLYGSDEKVVGDRLGIEALVGSHIAYDEIESPTGLCSVDGLFGHAGVLAHDANVIQLSRSWLANHPVAATPKEAD